MGEARTIKLPGSVLAVLERHRAMQAEEKRRAKSREDPRLMFPNKRGGVHRRNSVMLNAGVPVNVVSQALGHKDPPMTLKRYAHVPSDAQQIAADRIDAYGF